MNDVPNDPPTPEPEVFPPEVYEQLRAIARARMSHERIGHTLQTTALLHEALMRLTADGQIKASADRAAFFRAAADSMRRILIDHARAHRRQKRGGSFRRVSMEEVDLGNAGQKSVDLLALDEAICRLAEESADAATVTRLRFYAGLSVDETAEAMGNSPRSVDRLWAFARAWLWRALKDDATEDEH